MSNKLLSRLDSKLGQCTLEIKHTNNALHTPHHKALFAMWLLIWMASEVATLFSFYNKMTMNMGLALAWR